MKKLLDLKKVFSNLEPEGRGRGIIMGVTRLATSPRAILHHTDPKAPMGGVYQLFSTKMNLVEKSHSTFSSDEIVQRSA